MLSELARGGMGVIHLASSRGPGGFEKLVVVKELKHELAEDRTYTAMFLDEARLAAQLSHRHIVQTNEVGCEDGRYFMALELLEGASLHQIRNKLGVRALPLNLGLRVLVAVLDALDYAHELTDHEGRSLGIVHRDVSPQNVFVTFDGGVKLIDFGIAKSTRRDQAAVTQVGVVKGSIPYMSPDHVDGSSIDRRADVFAVGVLLREMLLGERLWGDADDLTMLRRLMSRDLLSFPGDARFPSALRTIVQRAMAPDRSQRYPTAAAMRDALEDHLRAADPRGTLDDLGAWLGRAFADERAAFRALVKRGRTISTATTVPDQPLWLPSSALFTRISALPAMAERRGFARTHARSILTAAMFAGALALGGLGLMKPGPARRVAPSAERAPRAADEIAPSTLVSTSPSMTREEPMVPEEPEEAEETKAYAAMTTEVLSTVSPVPAAVLREALPPNPYAAEE